MGITLNGKELSREIEERLTHEIDVGKEVAGRSPGLAVIRVGNDPASGVYVKNKEKACSRIGIKSFGLHLDQHTSSDDLINEINKLNQNTLVDGILLQLPLPKGLDSDQILKSIKPDKDVDGLHPLNLGKLLKGEYGPRSCTPAGIMALLAKNQISIEGKRAVVIGRSVLVGKPMALMLDAANATVTIAHSKTKNLSQITQQAEILVVAAGQPKLIDQTFVKEGAVVIDVGIHRVQNVNSKEVTQSTKLCGDVDYDKVSSKISAITPVPGGVGPMTVSMLLVNTVKMWQKHCDLSFTLSDLLP